MFQVPRKNLQAGSSINHTRSSSAQSVTGSDDATDLNHKPASTAACSGPPAEPFHRSTWCNAPHHTHMTHTAPQRRRATGLLLKAACCLLWPLRAPCHSAPLHTHIPKPRLKQHTSSRDSEAVTHSLSRSASVKP